MLTIVMAVYGQPLMLEKWWETLRSYDDEVLDKVHLIIVDDHGDPPVEIPDDVMGLLNCRLYRVMDDIPWNQMGARNLGMAECSTEWALMLDPDMVVEPIIAKHFLQVTSDIPKGSVCLVRLRHPNGAFDTHSPNIYLIRKSDFDRVGGYDEDYRGHKGWSDVQFLHTLEGFKMKFVKLHEIWARFYGTKDISDAAVMTLDRDHKHNKVIHVRKMRDAQRVGMTRWVKSRKGGNIRFRWARVR